MALTEPGNYSVLYSDAKMKYIAYLYISVYRKIRLITSTIDWKMSHYDIISVTLIDIIISRWPVMTVNVI